MDVEAEEWRPVAKYPGCEVSNLGRFKKENGTIISPQLRKQYVCYGWKKNKIRHGTTVCGVMKAVWPEVPRGRFNTPEWAKELREINELANPKSIQSPPKEPEVIIEWDKLDYFPGCRSQYDAQYCPLG